MSNILFIKVTKTIYESKPMFANMQTETPALNTEYYFENNVISFQSVSTRNTSNKINSTSVILHHFRNFFQKNTGQVHFLNLELLYNLNYYKKCLELTKRHVCRLMKYCFVAIFRYIVGGSMV